MSFLQIVTSIIRNVTIHRSFYVLVTTCLRVVTNSYELVTSIYESFLTTSIWILQISMYHHSTTDIQTDNMAYERNRLQLYQQLLLQIAQREEAQQLPDIPRPRRRRWPARRRVWCSGWPTGPSFDSMIISCMSWTEKILLATGTFSELTLTCLERFLTAGVDPD